MLHENSILYVEIYRDEAKIGAQWQRVMAIAQQNYNPYKSHEACPHDNESSSPKQCKKEWVEAMKNYC